MTKPVTGLTTFGAATSGTTTQLDNNFIACTTALNDLNTYSNYLIAGGSANALTVTLAANLTGALTDGLKIQVKILATNTAAATLNYNGNGAIAITQLDGSSLSSGMMPINGIVELQYSSGAGAWLLQTPLVNTSTVISTQVEVRQTALTGPIDANGFSTLLPASCNSLTYTTANITASAPLVVASANGYLTSGANNAVGYTTGNLTFNCTANAVNYLGVVVAANGNMSTVALSNANGVQPTYQWGGSYSTTNNNYTFNIQDMVMKAGNGSAAAQTFAVFVGECNCNSNSVVTAVSYAYKGRYTSAFTATLPGSTTAITFNHNLGVNEDVDGNVEIECTTIDQGWAVGDRINKLLALGTNYGASQGFTRTTYIWPSENSATGWRINPKTGGDSAAATNASWKYRAHVWRRW